MPSPIEDYALLSDCQAAALVAKDGSIDWLCWPSFDSDACFAALLGTRDHGRWLVAPTAAANVTRQYLGDSLVLETRFETPEGVVRVVDFMSPQSAGSDLTRLVIGERGAVAMHTELVVRFGYGAVVPWVSTQENGTLRAIAGPDQVVLRTSVPLRGEGLATVGDFTVRAGETISFSLTYRPSHLPPPEPVNVNAGLEDTLQFWQAWATKARVSGDRERGAIMRSLLTLKGLTFAATGGIVAAATTSLPESLGGIRNWDYRFCWLRDATLTLLALMNAGYYEEAAAWRDWLLRAVAGTPSQTQIMYGIRGERRLTEWEIDWLPGYEGSKPVRVGNGAHGQLQLDVFGEVMDALYQSHRGGVTMQAESWAVLRALLEHLETIWKQPDRGIWESRGAPRHFTLSKVMAWVAFDRGIKLATEAGLEGPIERWRAAAAEVHRDVCANGFDAALDSFVQSYGSKWLDGSLLLIPTTGFLGPNDERIAGTVRAVEGRLMSGGFVMRHDPAEIETGLAHGEGAFLACTLWLADAYVLLGRAAEAMTLFERVRALCNDVGLLSEAYDVGVKRLVGNFPQAFSHIALINTAHNLFREEKPVEQRSGVSPGRNPGQDPGQDPG